MDFHLYKVAGYEESIMSLRMSKGKFYSWEKAQEIQKLVHRVTDEKGFILDEDGYVRKNFWYLSKLTQDEINRMYVIDVTEFKRLLTLTFDQAMHKMTHHTLMKYIDISFFTDGLHRGAQDDLDAHAIGFNNRITRFSTRLAQISEQKVSEWYEDKIIPFADAHEIIGLNLPPIIEVKDEIFKLTPFGYVAERYATVPTTNGRDRDVQRGLMGLATPGPAIWKSDFFNLRYIYHMRSKLTKAHPELKDGMEILADKIEKSIPIFGPYFRLVFTDSQKWEHTNKVKTITAEEMNLFDKLLREKGISLYEGK